MPSLALNESILEPVDVGVPSTYIMRCSALEQLLFDRNLTGAGFAAACLRASEAFVSHMEPELRQASATGVLAELLLLSKGLCYSMGQAVRNALGLNLQLNLVATSRRAVDAHGARIAVTYTNLDAGGTHLIIGDTLATGASVRAALDVFATREEPGHVWLFAIAGSGQGARSVAAYCEERGIALTVVFGLAAFGLAANGFDLAFQHPETVARPEYVERANSSFAGMPISAVGWDFGSQMLAIRRYRQLCWLEARYWGIQPSQVFSDAEEPTADACLVGPEFPARSGDKVVAALHR